MNDRFLKIETAAELTELSPETIKKWIQAKEAEILQIRQSGQDKRIRFVKVCKGNPQQAGNACLLEAANLYWE